MYYYRPPKKNFFGHSMKRFSPEKQRQLAEKFLEKATIGSEVSSSNLTIGSPMGPKTPSFQSMIESVSKILGDVSDSVGGSLTRDLIADEFERCVRWLINEAPLPSTRECFVMMTRNHRITNWRIENVAMPTESTLNEIYGTLPTVQPIFSFETRPQYVFVKSTAQEMSYFKMDDSHLKEG